MLLVAPVLVLFGMVLLVGLSKGYDYSVGAMLQSLGQWFKTQAQVTIAGFSVGFGFIGDGILSLDHVIRRAIGDGIEAMKDAWTGTVGWLAYLIGETGSVIGNVAESTGRALQQMARVTVPAIVAAALGPLWTIVRQLQAVTHATVTQLPAAVTRVYHVTKSYPVKVERVIGLPRLVRTAVHAAVAGLAGTLIFPRIGQLERDLQKARVNVSKLGNLIGLGTIVGAVGYALSKLGLGAQSCSNVKRLNKGLCGFHPSLIENLLTDALLIASAISIVEFATECKGFVADVETPLRDFVRELRDLKPLKGTSYTAELEAYAAGNF